MRVLGRGGLRVRVVLAFLGITWKLLLSHRSRGEQGKARMTCATQRKLAMKKTDWSGFRKSHFIQLHRC